MLFFLTQLSLSDDLPCVADPINLPQPLDGKKLQFSQVLIRHGARTPLKASLPQIHRGFWICDSDSAYAPRIHGAPVNHYRRFKQIIDNRLVEFLPNCRPGDLTLYGMEMHYKLGQAFNNYLFTDPATKLFDSLPVDPQQVFIRNTYIERTLRSAESFLQGAFPPQSPNEIFDIYTDSGDVSILRPDDQVCSEIGELMSNVTSQTSFQEWVQSVYDQLAASNIPEQFGLETDKPNWTTIDDMCDYIYTSRCNGKRLPFTMTDDIFALCMNTESRLFYDIYNVSRFVPASHIVREMVRVANLSISETDPNKKIKFSLLSAHDSSVAAVYTLLGLPETIPPTIPPYASYLVMELWSATDSPSKIDDYIVRFSLNGENIPLTLMNGQTEVTFPDFLEAYKEIYQHCTNLPLS